MFAIEILYEEEICGRQAHRPQTAGAHEVGGGVVLEARKCVGDIDCEDHLKTVLPFKEVSKS